MNKEQNLEFNNLYRYNGFCYNLTVESILRFKKIKITEALVLKTILAWIFILSILYSTLSLVRHNNFQSGAFDLGIYDQAIWKYSQLIYPYSTIKERFILGDHLTLTLPALSPLFYLWNDVRILLIFQALFISFSTLAIYKIARNRNFSPLSSFNLAFIYSLFYGIQFGVYFDFHPVIIGVGILAWLVYFFESKKKKLFIIFLVLLLLTQENMGIALSSLGFLYLFDKKFRKQAVFFIIGGFLAGIISTRIVSLMSPVGYEYSPAIEHNPVNLISRFFDTPDKRLVWFYSFSSFSFLPLLSPGAILAVSLDLAQYFLPSKQFGHMVTPFLHHRAILSIFLILGAMQTLAFLKSKKLNINYLSIILVVSLLLQQYIFHHPLNKLIKKEYWRNESWMSDNRELLKIVPQKASIASQQNLVPHLAHRKDIFLLWPRKHDFKDKICEQKNCWWLDFAGKPEYMVVNLDERQWITQLLESPENFKSAVVNMEKDKKITKVKNINSAYLYKINY